MLSLLGIQQYCGYMYQNIHLRKERSSEQSVDGWSVEGEVHTHTDRDIEREIKQIKVRRAGESKCNIWVFTALSFQLFWGLRFAYIKRWREIPITQNSVLQSQQGCVQLCLLSAEWIRGMKKGGDLLAALAIFKSLPSFVQFICEFEIHIPGRPIQRKAAFPVRIF